MSDGNADAVRRFLRRMVQCSEGGTRERMLMVLEQFEAYRSECEVELFRARGMVRRMERERERELAEAYERGYSDGVGEASDFVMGK